MTINPERLVSAMKRAAAAREIRGDEASLVMALAEQIAQAYDKYPGTPSAAVQAEPQK